MTRITSHTSSTHTACSGSTHAPGTNMLDVLGIQQNHISTWIRDARRREALTPLKMPMTRKSAIIMPAVPACCGATFLTDTQRTGFTEMDTQRTGFYRNRHTKNKFYRNRHTKNRFDRNRHKHTKNRFYRNTDTNTQQQSLQKPTLPHTHPHTKLYRHTNNLTVFTETDPPTHPRTHTHTRSFTDTQTT